MLRHSLLILTLGINLASCFKLGSSSVGETAQTTRVKKALTNAGGEILAETKVLSQINSAATSETLLSPPVNAALTGSGISIPPGSLGVSASMVFEQAADLGDTTLTSEIALAADVSVSTATAGMIIRPTEAADLKKPLTISMPLPTLALHLANNSGRIVVFYKYFDPSANNLIAGMKIVDGSSVRLGFDEKSGLDIVIFEGYFGAYWVAYMSREISKEEVPLPQPATEPVLNLTKTPVIENSGVVTEKEIVKKQAVPDVIWKNSKGIFDAGKRLLSLSAAIEGNGRVLSSCKGEVCEDIKATKFTSQEALKPLALDYAVEKRSTHSLWIRFRCTDELGRITVSPWSDAIAIAAAKPSAPSAIGTGAASSLSVDLTVSWANDEKIPFTQHRVKLCETASCGTCGEEVISKKSPAAIKGIDGKTLYACVRSEEESGLVSDWVPSLTATTIDTTVPEIVAIGSDTPNGFYKVGDSISVQLQYSENVFVKGLPKILLNLGANNRSATYVSGSGSTVLNFAYTLQATDTSADLDLYGAGMESDTAVGIVDSSGNAALLSYPKLGLASTKAIVVDTLAPTAPGNPQFQGANSSSTSLSLSFTASTDVNLKNYQAKLCQASDCSTNCGTAVSSATSPISLTGSDSSSYYGCIRADDSAGNSSAWVATTAPIIVDTSIPTVAHVSSAKSNGAYKVGEVIDIAVSFTEAVTLVGTALTLQLESGSIDRVVAYSSGSGTAILHFLYTVQAGDASQDLDHLNTNALQLATGMTLRDSSGNDANLGLPTPGSSLSLGGQKALIIDTTAPVPPSALAFSGSTLFTSSFPLSFTAGSDLNFDTHNVALCSAATCNGTCIDAHSSATSPATMSGTFGSTYYGCVQAKDGAGNLSAWVASSPVTLNAGIPAILDVTSSKADGSYKVGEVIVISVQFSEAVLVSNTTPLLLLETGSTDRTATYQTGHGTDTLNFFYTVQANDVSSDLEIHDAAAMTLAGGGTLRDATGNDAVLTLPMTGAHALSTHKALIIDTQNPTAPGVPTFPSAAQASTSASFSWAAATDSSALTYNINVCTNTGCSTDCKTQVSVSALTGSVVGVNGVSYYACVQAQDAAGNHSAWIPSASSVLLDVTAPTVSSVTSSSADNYYGPGSTLSMSVSFSEAVIVTSGAGVNLLLETGATDRNASYSSGSGSSTLTFSYTVQAGDSSSDLEVASPSALTATGGATIRDQAGNNAVLTLPALGSASSLAGSKALLIDGILPSAPSSVGFASAYTASSNVDVSWGASTDINLSLYTSRLCTSNNCTTGCGSSQTTVGTTSNISGLTDGTSYYACVRSNDLAGNSSAYVASIGTVTLDSVATTVSSVTAPPNTQKAGNSVAITVNFSENVFVTGSGLSLTLETGATDREASYVSGSGSSALVFDYTVQSGDISADLNYVATNSLYLTTSTVKDAAGNNATLTLPALADVSSLAGTSAVIIDTIAPTAPATVSLPSSPSFTNQIAVSWTAASDTNLNRYDVQLCAVNDCSTACVGTSVAYTPDLTKTISGTEGGTYYACVRAQDSANNASAWTASSTTIYLEPAPVFAGIASAEVIGSNGGGYAEMQVTLAGIPSGNGIQSYTLFYSSDSSSGFQTLSTINKGDSIYDPNPADNELKFPVPVSGLFDGYFRVFYTDIGNYHPDANGSTSALTYVLKGHPGYALIPKKFSGLGYDYFMMRYEASLSAAGTNSGGDTVTEIPQNKMACEAKFHQQGTATASECGSKVITKSAVSVPGVNPANSINFPAAYYACRNGSDSNAITRLPSEEEWRRAALYSGSDYATYDSVMKTVCNVSSGTVGNTGSMGDCKSSLGLYDMAGNVAEWVDNRVIQLNLTNASLARFSYGPNVGQTLPNGIDNTIRRYRNFDPGATTRAVTMGAYTTASPARTYGAEASGMPAINATSNRVGFRCMGFRNNARPTPLQVALPDEPKYSAGDYSGAANTWKIPESSFAGDAKAENFGVSVNGNTTDSVVEGQVTLSWSPWSKHVSDATGTVTDSNNFSYHIYRFIAPNYESIRYAIPWASAQNSGSVYYSGPDKLLDPLWVDSSGERVYTAATTLGRLVGSVGNCNSSYLANCTFTDFDGAGTGFTPSKIYQYIIVAADAEGNEIYPTVQRFRTGHLVDQNGGPKSRQEPRFRRAALAVLDDGYQDTLSSSQSMVFVPMDKSGHDHDYYIYKYEAAIGSGIITNGSTSATWPLQSSSGVSMAGQCEEYIKLNLAMSPAFCGDGTTTNPTTANLQSKKALGVLSNADQGAIWKACHATQIVDSDSKSYLLRMPSPVEWFKAADWGDVNLDGTIDQNSYASGSISSLEAGAADTTTNRCHSDSSPGSYYATDDANTTNCRSRYGAFNMVGNVAEWTTGQINGSMGMDDGQEGLWTAVSMIGGSDTIANLGGKYNLFAAFPQSSGTLLGSSNNDYFAIATSGLRAAMMGGQYSDQDDAGRFSTNMNNAPSVEGGGRCAY